jgi:hypothetical protein
MASKKLACEASSWAELESLVSLDVVKAALKFQEAQRLAHKKAYLKRQALIARAKELGLDKEI